MNYIPDLTASRRTEDMKKLPDELDKDTMKKQVNALFQVSHCLTHQNYNRPTQADETHVFVFLKQVTFDTGNESISSAETEALLSHSLSVCPDSEGTVHVFDNEVKMYEWW